MTAKIIPFPRSRIVRRRVIPAEPVDEDVLMVAKALLANMPSQRPKPKPKKR